MKWSRESKWIVGAFSLTMLLMGAISLVSYQNVTRLVESANKVKQTHEVLETLISLLAALNEAEAGRRGYIYFGDRLELERYSQAMKMIDPKLNQLRRLIDGDAPQKQQLATLESLLAERSSLAQQSITLYQRNPVARPAQMALVAANTHNRQQIQKLIAEMQQRQEQSLESSVNQSRSSMQRRVLLEILGTSLTFMLLLSLYALLYRQMVKRQQAETLQRRLAQEKELSELKLEFFSMVSHEFRTPLSIILGSAQLLEKSLQPQIEKPKLKSLYRILSAARLMTQLLSDILTLARADAGRLEYSPEQVELQSFCLNLVEEIQVLSESHHAIQLTVQDQCTYARVDEKLLHSILSNLLSNAIKYSPEGGNIFFILICEPRAVTFQVKDEGIGIPPETQSLLYEPFRRGSNVGRILGTGLGLAVVKKCLDLHQGNISVKSQVGVGTTFTVTIPQHDSPNS